MGYNVIRDVKKDLPSNMTEDQTKMVKEALEDALRTTNMNAIEEFYTLQVEIEKDVEALKAMYRTKLTAPHKTKADVLKDIWTILPEILDKPVPPIDEELLAAYAEMPADDGEEGYIHPWGIASKMYKSVAIDAFGQKYLLGVFETEEEYQKAKAEMQMDMQEWSKQENARLDKDPAGRERIQKVLEEARSGGGEE